MDKQEILSSRAQIKIEIIQIFNKNKYITTEIKEQSQEDIQLDIIKDRNHFYMDKNIIEQIKFFDDKYNNDKDQIQITITSSKNIIQPTIDAFKNIIMRIYNKSNKLNLKNSKEFFQHYAASCVLRNPNIISLDTIKFTHEILLNFLLISIQYQAHQQSELYYSILRDIILYQAGVINNLQSEITQKLAQENLTFILPDTIVIFQDNLKIKINTLIFKLLYEEFYFNQASHLIPLQKYIENSVKRDRSNTVNIIDYPHYYTLISNQNDILYAKQENEHSEIVIHTNDYSYQPFSRSYVGIIERNYWGNQFFIYDYGVEEKFFSSIPLFFAAKRQKVLEIKYEISITQSKPRSFQAIILNLESKEIVNMSNVEPLYNNEFECYQLNFFGRALNASARNFQLIIEGDQNIYLLHGKKSKNEFNLDYRHPLTSLQAFAFSLTSISKKFMVV